jgi:cyclic beta-1,2-glucan synthetase
MNPGYIKGYVPGVRENGGQYTHGAIWMAMAFAQLGDSRRAWELMAMINPVNHAQSPEATAKYKVEPYAVAADIYAVSPHIGRGGWTWYTGSAGWMYRLITESLLGLTLTADRLSCAPLLPAHWEGFTVHYRYRETVYHIAIRRGQVGDGTAIATVDGVPQQDTTITLVDDHKEHWAEVRSPAG